MNPISKEWLTAAGDDILVIEKIIDDVRLTHLVAFHAQQAIEKSLKALLEHRGNPVPKAHSLNRLFELCSVDLTLSDSEIINTLDGLYLDSRYPSALGLLPDGKPGTDDARAFYDFAVAIHQRISSIVSGVES